MPPKVKVTKEEILLAALDTVREGGEASLNVRAVASRLGVSTQPVFSNYESMDALRADVTQYANRLYTQRTKELMASGRYPPYKASGMAYILFAQEERELFKLLFMRNRDGKQKRENDFDNVGYIIDLIQKNLNIDRETANLFHLEMWTFVHGIATMYATNYLELDTDTVDKMLTDAYEGLSKRFTTGGSIWKTKS